MLASPLCCSSFTHCFARVKESLLVMSYTTIAAAAPLEWKGHTKEGRTYTSGSLWLSTTLLSTRFVRSIFFVNHFGIMVATIVRQLKHQLIKQCFQNATTSIVVKVNNRLVFLTRYSASGINLQKR